MRLKKEHVVILFKEYAKLRKGTSGYELDWSDIDYDAFIEALNNVFYDTSPKMFEGEGDY